MIVISASARGAYYADRESPREKVCPDVSVQVYRSGLEEVMVVFLVHLLTRSTIILRPAT